MAESGATGARLPSSEERPESGARTGKRGDRALGQIAGGQKLSWNEVRVRAARFAAEWQDARYEKGETQTYNEFFEIFGVRRRQVATFEEPVKKLGDKQGFIDLFWKGLLLVEQKSAGRDLIKAKEQALDYFPNLKDYELPRYILVSDFQTFELYDLDEGEAVKFPLADLPQHVEAFGFILGITRFRWSTQEVSG
jgi:restriction-modification enzyme MmeI-like protein